MAEEKDKKEKDSKAAPKKPRTRKKAVEETFKVKFKSMELLRLKNVGDLQKLLDSKLAS